MKKLISVLLAVILLCSVFTVSVYSAETDRNQTSAKSTSLTYKNYEYKVLKDSTIKILKYKGTETDLKIPAKIKNKKVTQLSKYSFFDNDYIETLTIPKTITLIGSSAFKCCDSLETVNFPATAVRVRADAFSYCSSLKRVNITDLTKWCETQFANPAANPVRKGKKLYLNGELITDLVIPEGVTEIGYCNFMYATKIKSVKIADSVKLIRDNAFYNCKSLEKLDLGNGVEEIKAQAFGYCVNLNNLKIPASVKTLEWGAFYSCAELAHIDFSENDLSCSETPFLKTKWLENQPEGLVLMDDGKTAWYYKGTCPAEFVIPDGVEKIGKECFTYQERLEKIVIPDSVKVIGPYAFSDCVNLGDVYLPDSVTEIGDGAFDGCESFREFNLGKNVESLGKYALAYCYNLKKVTLNDNIKVIPEGLFRECFYLENVDYPAVVTEIGNNAFYYCTKLENFPLKDNSDTIKVIGNGAFYRCYQLEKVVIPEKVKVIDSWTFANCTNLKKVTISKNVELINSRAFADCSALEKVVYNAENCKIDYYTTVTYVHADEDHYMDSDVKKRQNVFLNCDKLTTFVIGKTVKKLPEDLFRDVISTSLKKIEIRNGLKSISYKKIDKTKKAVAKKGTYNSRIKVDSEGNLNVVKKGTATVKFKTKNGTRKVKMIVIDRI